MILFSLIPESWRPYAKTVVASIGLVLSAIVVAVPSAPDWAPVALAFLTALGVYAQPNADANSNGIPEVDEAAIG